MMDLYLMLAGIFMVVALVVGTAAHFLFDARLSYTIALAVGLGLLAVVAFFIWLFANMAVD